MRCKDCAYLNTMRNICLLMNRNINPEGQKCQHFKSKELITKCDACGKITIDTVIYINEEETKTLCPNCVNKTGTCELCKQRFYCEFETNASNLPKTVIKQVRQGPAIMQTEMRNPERIEITCKNCICWDKEEQYCLKENGTCGRYELCFG